MRSVSWVLACALMCGLGAGAPGVAAQDVAAHAAAPFSVRDALRAPYALGLTVAPDGEHYAWVENTEGVRNIWVASTREDARAITHYTEDDAQDVGGLAWSPDSKAIAYTLGAESGASGRPANPAELQRDTALAVWVQGVDGKRAALRVGEGHAPVWVSANEVAFVRAGKIWAVRVGEAGAAPAAQQLVFDRGSASSLAVSSDGAQLAYVSHRGSHQFIGLFDLARRTLRFVGASTGNDSAPVFSRDGRMLAWLREPYTDAPEFAANRVSANPWSVMVADVATLTARAAYVPAAGKLGSVIPRFATGDPKVWWAAGTTLLFCSEADGWNHLYAMDAGREGAAARLLTPLPGEVEDVSVSADGGRVVFASNMRAGAGSTAKDADWRRGWVVDLARGDGLSVLPGEGILTRPHMLRDGTVVALASDAKVPMHPVLLVDGKVRNVREGWLPEGYPGDEFVEPVQVEFASRLGGGGGADPTLSRRARKDGPPAVGAGRELRIHGQLFLPKDGKTKHAALLFFHGGPRRQMLLGYPAMDYYSNAYAMNEWFAAHGYVVLSVNYRCGIGYGMEFRECEHSGADGAAEYNDALAAVAYLRGRSDVDMSRVGIWGGSYGGYFTALGLARNSDVFRAGVDFHGVHDWTLEDNAPHDWLRGTNAEQDAIAAKAKASSPIADVGRWRSPVLLIHGDDDPEVTYRQTPMLADALRARGVHVEELVFPDETHGFLLHRDWVRAYEAMADFFARELK